MAIEQYKNEIKIKQDITDLSKNNTIELRSFDPNFYLNYNSRDLVLFALFNLGKYREKKDQKPVSRFDDLIVQFYLYFPEKLQLSDRWPFPDTKILSPLLAELIKSRYVFCLNGSSDDLSIDTILFLTSSGFERVKSIFNGFDLPPMKVTLEDILGNKRVTGKLLKNSFPINYRRLQEMDIFTNWEGDLPKAATIQELSKLLELSRSSPFRRFIHKFNLFFDYVQLYDYANYEYPAKKVVRFMLIQAFYRYDYMDKDKLGTLNSLAEEFEVLDRAKKAKKIILDDIVAS